MSKAFLGFLKDKHGERLIWGHHHERRWFLHVGEHTLKFEYGHVSGLRHLGVHAGGGYVEGMQIAGGIGYMAWLTWSPPWKVQQRIPFMRHHDAREWGIKHSNGKLRLMLGQEHMGTWYGGIKGWRRWLKNREITLFDFEWIVGRYKVERTPIMETRRMLIPVGEWDGDEYVVDVSAEQMTWRNRVQTKRRKYWDFKTPEGEKAPPIPGNPESDFYDGDDGIYGFSEPFEKEPIPAYRARIIEARRRHSRPGWRPEALRLP